MSSPGRLLVSGPMRWGAARLRVHLPELAHGFNQTRHGTLHAPTGITSGIVECDEAHSAAVKALQKVCPDLTWKDASAETTKAVHYARVYHKEWFWSGVGSRNSPAGK